jgi:hypothetical protein
MNKNNQHYTFITERNTFFFQIGKGVTANAVLLLLVLAFLLQHRPRPTDLTIGHLALIQVLMPLTRVFVDTDVWGLRTFGRTSNVRQ